MQRTTHRGIGARMLAIATMIILAIAGIAGPALAFNWSDYIGFGCSGTNVRLEVRTWSADNPSASSELAVLCGPIGVGTFQWNLPSGDVDQGNSYAVVTNPNQLPTRQYCIVPWSWNTAHTVFAAMPQEETSIVGPSSGGTEQPFSTAYKNKVDAYKVSSDLSACTP